MTTLIFGGLGHVGSWVVHDLLERGDDVVVFDANPGAIERPELAYLAQFGDRLRLESVDILDAHRLFELMRRYEREADAVVFGVAVIAGPHFKERPFRNIETNTTGMLNVIETCRILSIPKFVNLSSGAVYGNAAGGQTEATPYQASDLYCATKICNEVLALQYGATYGFDVLNARLMAVYGPGRMPSRMHVLYQALFGPLEGLEGISVPSGRDQAMDWTHVRDTARGIVAVLDNGTAGQSYNIALGEAVAHTDIVERVSEIVGHPTKIELGPGRFFERGSPLDVSKARTELGFAPQFTDLRAALEDYHAWIRSVPGAAG